MRARQRNDKWLAAGWILAMGLASVGCVSSTTGNEGNLEFFYAADDEPGNFNKPIAVGAKLDLFVRDAGAGGDRQVTLVSASTDDESIARIVEFEGNEITLEGVGEGSFRIEVEANVAATEETETDSVDMLVRVPEKVLLSHTCGGESTGYYLAGQDVYVPFEMKMNDGQNVIGYGYYPVEHEPAEAMTRDESHQGTQYIRYNLGEETGTVTVSSTLDEATIDLELVEIGQADGATLSTPEVKLEDGQTHLRYVLPTIAGKPICQAIVDLSVTSTSEDVCDVSRVGDAEIYAKNNNTGSGWLEIAAKKEGTCTFDVTFPGANGGEGVTESFELTVD